MPYLAVVSNPFRGPLSARRLVRCPPPDRPLGAQRSPPTEGEPDFGSLRDRGYWTTMGRPPTLDERGTPSSMRSPTCGGPVNLFSDLRSARSSTSVQPSNASTNPSTAVSFSRSRVLRPFRVASTRISRRSLRFRVRVTNPSASSRSINPGMLAVVTPMAPARAFEVVGPRITKSRRTTNRLKGSPSRRRARRSRAVTA